MQCLFPTQLLTNYVSNRETGLCDTVVKEKKIQYSFNLTCSDGLIVRNLGFNTENTP